MRLRQFYDYLRRARKQTYQVGLGLYTVCDEAISLEFPDEPGVRYCPLTAVARVKLGVRLKAYEFRRAAILLEIPEETGTDIAYAADIKECNLLGHKRRRAAMLRAVGLAN
jgi:hypothetical protein